MILLIDNYDSLTAVFPEGRASARQPEAGRLT